MPCYHAPERRSSRATGLPEALTQRLGQRLRAATVGDSGAAPIPVDATHPGESVIRVVVVAGGQLVPLRRRDHLGTSLGREILVAIGDVHQQRPSDLVQ